MTLRYDNIGNNKHEDYVEMLMKNVGGIDATFEHQLRRIHDKKCFEKQISSISFSIRSTNLKNFDKLLSIVESNGFSYFDKNLDVSRGLEPVQRLFRRGLETINISGRKNSEISLYGWIEDNQANMDFIKAVRDFYEENKIPYQKKGEVHVLVQSKEGISPYMMGNDYCEIERENYSEEVLEAYDKTIKEFNRDDPSGTISIFSGPPGTGKTYLVRSLLGNIEKAKFLYMPADMIRDSAGPGLISVLQEMSEELDEFPPTSVGEEEEREEDDQGNVVKKRSKLVLILEDADLVLAPREETDISGISSLLNLTDGIIGKLLNCRIIATTNSPAKTLDKAILRKGRICSDAIVNLLPYGRAVSIYKRLGGKKDLPERSYILADLYYLATHPEEEIEDEKKRKVGFG